MAVNKKQQKLLEIYKQKMAGCIDNNDKEIGHIRCDGMLCDLLHELGFDEILEIYDKQIKWYA